MTTGERRAQEVTGGERPNGWDRNMMVWAAIRGRKRAVGQACREREVGSQRRRGAQLYLGDMR